MKSVPEDYLNIFEKKLIERLLNLIVKENSTEKLEEFGYLISFLKNTEILSDFNLKYLKAKIEKMGKLSPSLFAYFFITNFK